MDNLEFKIHELPPTKKSDVIEIKFKKDVMNADLLRSLEKNFRKAGHEGLLLILPPDDEARISVEQGEDCIRKIKERISDQNNKKG